MIDKNKKPKIAILGLGTAGYEVVQKFAQKDDLENIDLHHFNLHYDQREIDPKINVINLPYRERKATLVDIAIAFINQHNCNDFKIFEKYIQEGDELYLSCNIGNCAPLDKYAFIKRNGKIIHYTRVWKMWKSDTKNSVDTTPKESGLLNLLRKIAGIFNKSK